MNLRQIKTVRERLKAIEKETGLPLTAIGSSALDDTVASERNCENMIGWTQIPLGVAGPVEIKFPDKKIKKVWVPLATTEGALVASVNRGLKALSESGPVETEIETAGTTRGPVFAAGNLALAKQLRDYITRNESELRRIAEATSRHLLYLGAQTASIGSYVYVRFRYDTGNAMGMNMVTIATEAVCRHLEKVTGARLVAVAGNFDTDKKPAWLNVISGRGQVAEARAELPRSIVEKTLKTSPEKIHEVWLAKCLIGSALSGSMGFNAHIANIVAAIFIATGQDPAHVVEAALGQTLVEQRKDSVIVTVRLPDLMAGTVGGGTALPTQREALGIMGIADPGAVGSKEQYARVVAVAVLAGEISLLASLAQGSLGRAHEKLARGGAGL